jgi:DNA-binding response OmpR family regulator
MLPQTKGARPRILVADDDDLLSEVLSQALQANGYAVARAPGGRFGPELVAEIDLVILDANIPGSDFTTTLSYLRDANIALLVLTGEPSPPTGVHAVEYLGKPVDLGQFLEFVARLTPKSARG